jgi:hypothetical protein
LSPVLETILSGRLAMRSVLLVGDHGAFREALAKVLEWEAGFEKVPQAGARASRTGSGCGVSVADVDPRRRLVVGAKRDPGGPPVGRRDAWPAADHQLRFERVRLDDATSRCGQSPRMTSL